MSRTGNKTKEGKSGFSQFFGEDVAAAGKATTFLPRRFGLQRTPSGRAMGHPTASSSCRRARFDREFNAFATLAVWIMTRLIQRANRRDTLALHAKLDECCE
jgi:hypothetical protein